MYGVPWVIRVGCGEEYFNVKWSLPQDKVAQKTKNKKSKEITRPPTQMSVTVVSTQNSPTETKHLNKLFRLILRVSTPDGSTSDSVRHGHSHHSLLCHHITWPCLYVWTITVKVVDGKRKEQQYWLGTESGLLGVFEFKDTCTTGDGSCDTSSRSMGAKFCTFQSARWDDTPRDR